MAKIILIPGSLRKDSLNKKLLEVCAESLKQKNIESHLVEQADLNVPLINADESTIPGSLQTLAEKIAAADGVIIGEPEYNAGMSPVIKNMIDWISTLRPHPWKGKAVLIVGTSPGDFGAFSGIHHAKVPLDRLGAFVWPQPYALPHGDKVIQGKKLSDETRQKNLEATLSGFIERLSR